MLEPASAIDTIADAFPEGLQLVAFLDHPVAAVQMAALAPATASGDPEALAHLGRLAGDSDAELATAASQAAERLVETLPPLRFELMGGFAVGRGSWRVGEGWQRPVDARLVRFLLANTGLSFPRTGSSRPCGRSCRRRAPATASRRRPRARGPCWILPGRPRA